MLLRAMMMAVEISVVTRLNPMACNTSGWRKFSRRFGGDMRRKSARMGILRKINIGRLKIRQMPLNLVGGVGAGGDPRIS